MTKILFASNNVSHFPGAITSSSAATFDATRVPYSIQLSNYELAGSPVFVPSSTDDTWFHFRTYANSYDHNRNDTWFQAYDAADNLLFTVTKRNSFSGLSSTIILYNGATTLSASTANSLTSTKANSVDIKYRVNGLLIRIEFYHNSILVASNQFNANANGYGKPVRFVIGAGLVSGLTDKQHYSEIIVAEDDTRNARLNLLRPESAGAYADWDGALAVLADDNSTTGMTTIAAAQRSSMIMSAYAGAPNISNVVTVSTALRGLNAPTGLKHFIRQSAVDYDGAVRLIPESIGYQLTDFPLNPATSLPWTAADLSTVEVGFLSVA